MGFIDATGLEKIKGHKYVSGSQTALEDAMQPFWNYSALLIPKKVAPNLVTLAGLVITILACLLILDNDQSMTKEAQPVYHLVAVFCLFMY